MPRQTNWKTYLEKIRDYYNKHGIIPNFENLTGLLGLKSKASIHKIFNKLTEMGYLVQEGKKFFPTEKFNSIPMFESVKAGIPDNPSEDITKDVNIQSYLIDKPTNTVLIKVQGDSMKDAGILDGDTVIIDKSRKPKIGEIIIARVDNEYTLKYLMEDKNGKKYLKPANQNYQDIYPTQKMEIFGTVIGNFRKY